MMADGGGLSPGGGRPGPPGAGPAGGLRGRRSRRRGRRTAGPAAPAPPWRGGRGAGVEDGRLGASATGGDQGTAVPATAELAEQGGTVDVARVQWAEEPRAIGHRAGADDRRRGQRPPRGHLDEPGLRLLV